MAILAAGSSRRFGERDKLAAPFRGHRLGDHIARSVGSTGFELACVISASGNHPCEPSWRESGFDVVVNECADEGMGTSVALAARRASESECDELLIALADMPMVPREHFARLIEAVQTPEDIQTSAIGKTRMPPAAFGRDHFPRLMELRGDKGARHLLAQGGICPCPPEWLIDIDTPEALAALERQFRSPN